MQKRSVQKSGLWATATIVASLLAGHAQAVPSYARQTGQDCASCHVGAFGPQLTPFGIKFKLGGYVDSDGKAGKIPLSGMVVADYNRFKDENNDNTKKSGIAEASVFLAGKLADHLGSFAQVTNSGIDHTTSVDQVDLRYTGTTAVDSAEALIGLSVNNNPTAQDPFNTLSVWGFPYTGSDHLAYPGSELKSASIEHRVMGVNAYTLVNDSIYAELGLYNTLSPAVQSRMGQGRIADTDAGTEFGSLRNAPYWRLGYMKDLHTRAWSVGLLGFNGTIKERATIDSTKFNDFGVDASYQFLGTREHVVTVNGSYLREHTTANVEGVDSARTTKDWRLATSYHYMNTYGATLGYVKATSSDQHTGNRAFIYQADWTPWGKESSWNAPWANLRVGLQYVAFKRSQGYDSDLGQVTVMAKPSDLNSTRLFAWTSF